MKHITLLLLIIIGLSACKNEKADGVLVIQTKYLSTNIGERPDEGATIYIAPYDSVKYFYTAGFTETNSAEGDKNYEWLKSEIETNEISIKNYKGFGAEWRSTVEELEKKLEQQRKDFAILEDEHKLWIDTVNMEIDHIKKICAKQTADKNGVCVFTLPGGRGYSILVESHNCIGESVFETNGKLNLTSKYVVANDTTSITIPMIHCKQ